eukprot:comp19180_c0_seq1/m.21883 comp19180_c0_seq1/g.21883  ORF comp19180_c0_seq1/g.21883 comp19180_c0_seq1/m.21883 type:complete len:527 (-) comp19180_c0_seq1:838-2418(-)
MTPIKLGIIQAKQATLQEEPSGVWAIFAAFWAYLCAFASGVANMFKQMKECVGCSGFWKAEGGARRPSTASNSTHGGSYMSQDGDLDQTEAGRKEMKETAGPHRSGFLTIPITVPPESCTIQVPGTGGDLKKTQQRLVTNMLDEYQIVQQLSQGPCTRVDLAVHRKTGVKVAMKRETKKTDNDDIMHLVKEANIQCQLKHPNIAIVEAVVDGTKEFAMLQEFVGGGDLFDCVQPDVGCPEPLTRAYIQQLCMCLEYMHGMHIVHRDIKPENICLTENKQQVKLIDFGLAESLRGGSQDLQPRVGTVPYMAPELWISMNSVQTQIGGMTPNAKTAAMAVGYVYDYDYKSIDVWATGIVLYTMLVGRFPWAHATFKSPEYMAYLRNGLDQGPFVHMAEGYRILLKGMLCVDPSRRWTAKQCREFIEGFKWDRPVSRASSGVYLPTLARVERSSSSSLSSSTVPGAPKTAKKTPPEALKSFCMSQSYLASPPPPISPCPNVTSFDFTVLTSEDDPGVGGFRPAPLSVKV